MATETIEAFAEKLSEGVKGTSRAALKGDLATWTAPTKKTPLDGAQGVREAILAHSGRTKRVTSWRGYARNAMGQKRMNALQYVECIEAGVKAGLFRVDDTTLKFPFFVLLGPVAEVEVASPSPKAKPPRASKVSNDPSKNWSPPGYLKCGHPNYQDLDLTEAEMTPRQVAYVKDTKNNRHIIRPRKTIKVTNVKGCTHCKAGKPGHPRYAEGKYRAPLKEAARRSPEREDGLGFPGLCADPVTGFYIGGLGNHCGRYHSGPERCVVHATKASKN